jgi:hypothetical protein
MSTAKLAATVLLAAAFLTQSSLASFAEDSNDDSTSQFSPTARPTAPAAYEHKLHSDKVKHHEEQDFQVAVPPMVITPDGDETSATAGSTKVHQAFKVSPPKGSPQVSKAVPDTAGKERVIEPNSAAFDPNANKPIQMQDVHITSKTPADVFMDSAKLGVGAMAAGAALLGVAAAVRGTRSRRKSDTDFIYEVEAQE